ncbi:MAG: flagellar motor stator protein MotA, partial [Oricola sp.]|nr:flagellar motor stator protein MotA [Oricola sp.]
MKFLIGLVIVTASMIGGYIGFGGHLEVLWQPYEVAIIVGAAVGVFILSNSIHVIKDTGTALIDVVGGKALKKDDYLDLLSLLFTIFREGKAKGIMALENDIERPEESRLFKAHPRA